jgi:DNA-binding transcriptional LysR family regulator
MKLSFRQLTYFIAAAQTGSITLASKRANISQPAISTAISHIERELDVQLFLRHHAQGLSLTLVRTMVANGLGYTLANVRPRADVALDGRRVHRVPLAGDSPPLRIGIATLKDLKKTCLVEAFERHCRELISETYIPGMAAADVLRRRKRR